ncbi:DUF6940 family protein [Blastopirellula marina]|uniref:Uncharacterized protein n=1 Tax=Blastopirellula marina TaxID=124 RepID=A0A2S8GB94_9BACT|nr:hypothetical protein [Blastopirellula marina]PQO41725.1 hypothetical protein C5Y98_03115 [Blastopirellula marina]PTL46168.1 hypothetical protein C5Y97_03115 [Blastopirellula marina]
MIEILTKPVSGYRASELRIVEQDVPVSFENVAKRWQESSEFCEQFNNALADVPYESFRWELPGLTSTNWHLPFECIVKESLELCRPANASSFEEYFVAALDDVAVFSNLGGNALLIVPTPVADSAAYPHLAAFTRQAPRLQRASLWRSVGSAFANRIGTKPVWLSTAGAGVPWLHVRLDDRPKYYSYSPYRYVLDADQ